MNRFKTSEEDTGGSEEQKPRTGGKFGRVLVSILNGSVLTRENVVRQLPFLFYLAFLIVCYIGYGYYTEQNVKETYKLEKELKELRSEYITSKSRLMFKSKRSEVVDATESIGLNESTTPPKKLVVPDKEE